MKKTCPSKILIVVSHPDDEALWVGGLLHSLEGLALATIHVICLSGAQDSSPRKVEFEAARLVAGYSSGVVMGGVLGAANEPLPHVGSTVAAGIEKLQLSLREIDLLLTHSPYGDEHMHPHHIQSCEELYEWTRRQRIPFGYFSCLPLINCSLEPILRNMKRLGSLQLLNYSRCRYGLLRLLTRCLEGKPWRYPIIYTQWLVDAEYKKKMLACYESIGLEKHMDGYAMFSSNVETIYVFDRRGMNVINRIVSAMEIPGAKDYFSTSCPLSGFKSKVLYKMRRFLRGE